MSSRTALVTGCGSGIGRATAKTLAERGWDVTATDPDPSALESLDAWGCETAELDVTEDGDPERVVEDVVDRTGRLDCVVNNAGYGQIGPLEELPTDRFREQFEVNVFGQQRVLRAALPHLREASGTVINLSSVVGRFVIPGQTAYSSSKWAVEGMSEALRFELDDHDVDVVVIEPGPVETNFGDRALAEKERLDRSGAYEWFYRAYDGDRYDRRLLDRGFGYVQPERVAETIATAADSEAPDRRYVVGPWKWLVVAFEVLPNSVRDAALGLVKKLP